MPALALINVTRRYVNRIAPNHFTTVANTSSVADIPAYYQAAVTAGDLVPRILVNERRRVTNRPAYGRYTALLVEDTVDPGVAITGPTSSPTYLTNLASLAISGTASDEKGIVSVTWANAGGATSGAATTSNHYANWSATVPLVAGANAITVTATDGSGNTTADVITVTRDSVAPVVAITLPATDPYENVGLSLSLEGTATDLASGVVSVAWANDQGGSGAATNTGTAFSTWSATVPLVGGEDNVITVTATDAAGNTATDTVLVTVAP